MFEGLPSWPDFGRFWSIVERYKVTKFYTAPTVIRMLIGAGDEHVKKYNRSSLKVSIILTCPYHRSLSLRSNCFLVLI